MNVETQAGLGYFFARMVYKNFVRGYLKKAINDPKSTWDNHAMSAIDKLFGIL